jgi:hypothetical protein
MFRWLELERRVGDENEISPRRPFLEEWTRLAELIGQQPETGPVAFPLSFGGCWSGEDGPVVDLRVQCMPLFQ